MTFNEHTCTMHKPLQLKDLQSYSFCILPSNLHAFVSCNAKKLEYFKKRAVTYNLDHQVLCSKIALLQNSSPGQQNSPPELQNRQLDIKTKGAILEFRGAILQSRGAILPGGYFAAHNLTVQTVLCNFILPLQSQTDS